MWLEDRINYVHYSFESLKEEAYAKLILYF